MLLRLFPILLVLSSCAGCQSPQKTMFDRQAVTRCLPPDVTLETVATAYSAVDKFTVEQELIELGAHVDHEGKLRDGSGKEIRFFREGEDGSNPSANEASLATLSKDFTVVTIERPLDTSVP
jgi:hypothetical protein